MKPSHSLLTFTDKLIDYAGLFPPASLDLATSLNNYLAYRSSHYCKILSRFVCPVQLLAKAEEILKNIPNPGKITVTALIKGGKNLQDFQKNLDGNIKSPLPDSGGINKVDMFELKLSDDVLKEYDEKKFTSVLNTVTEVFRNNYGNKYFVFVEGNTEDDHERKVTMLADSISGINHAGFNLGYKLRTGGTKAEDFPSAEIIAHSIRVCLDRKVPMKFTAGMHHPFIHYDDKIKTKMHGFINVFGAGIISMRHNLTNKGIEELINDEDPGSFLFTDEYFSWKDWKIDVKDIAYARQNLVTSFGSCSFEEPVEDLKSFELL